MEPKSNIRNYLQLAEPDNRYKSKLTGLTAMSQLVDNEPQGTASSSKRPSMFRKVVGKVPDIGHTKRNTDKNAGPRRIGFRKLEEFLNEDSDQLVVRILSCSGFSELFYTPELSPDYIVLIMRILSKVGECAFLSNKTKILELALVDQFLSQLAEFIMLIPIQSSMDKQKATYFWNNPDIFFKYFNNYCDMILTLAPSIALERVSKLVKAGIVTVPQVVGVSKDTKDMLQTLQEKLVIVEEEITSKYKKKPVAIDESELEPPDDFRKMSLYPLSSEITNRCKAFVRKNVIEGPYKNVEHYLDIQFRLLREDFVKPLREGICDYLEDNKKKPQNMKVYKDVVFLCRQMTNATCGVLIQLDIKDRKAFTNRHVDSRRFMFGSLMCFTSNNFGSVIFGKIVDSKMELLLKGQLIIEFESIYKVEFDIKYIMVESFVFFEPYYQVLNALQHLNENNFPMKKYIIEVRNDIEPPRYPPCPLFMLYDEDDEDEDDDDDEYFIQLNMAKVIPLHEQLAVPLNEAQQKACHSAMNESFSIIQGPPGTGKTYLALVIAKLLLNKRMQWHHGRYPLLVVCFTNHALDQFLEGLIPFTTRIVRIGGQSKNNNMELFNIRNVRSRILRKRNVRKSGKRYSHAYFSAANAVQVVNRNLRNLHTLLDIANNFLGLVNILDILRSEPELSGTWFENVTEKEFRDWIFGGEMHCKRREIPIKKSEESDIQNDENASSDTEFVHEIFDDLPEVLSRPYIISIGDLKSRIQLLHYTRDKIVEINDNVYQINAEVSLLEKALDYLQMRMTEGKTNTEFHQEEFIDFNEPHDIHPNDRWNLYFYWLALYREDKKRQIEECERDYQLSYEAYAELREIEDIEIMRSKLVVGMTTTGAARLRRSLKALKSPIVIVEEAAEIMESHVITSLTEHCTHLILIGDHQQLRPNTADYTMDKQYHLSISLFERMVRNNINCNVLSVQHRMRPEIAKLVAPNIYPHLKNHDSVHDFPPVRGVDPSLYFITHEHLEEECTDQSKSNLHEVTFLLRLAKYLLLNGYEPEEITILAAYSGQMFALLDERKKFELLKDVRITVLDNYQGEESKIILLSLVRNNKNGKIGFLSLENRVCVALSRAKEGLYIMGNIDLLCSHSQIWPKIRNVLEEQNNLGTSLALRCQIHQDRVTTVVDANDFYKVPEGGCDFICNQNLDCGHQCKSYCHVIDRGHDVYQCKEMCKKILCDNGHICPELCFKECGQCKVPMLRKLPCGHETEFPCHQNEFVCTYPVSAELPCTHKVDNKPCYMDVEKFRCPYPCDTRIDSCGHACVNRCHIMDDPDHLQYKCYKPCARMRSNCSINTEEHICPKYCFQECQECDIVIQKERSCTHFFKVACACDVETVVCKKPCKKLLPCGHPCKLKCYEVCGSCTIQVKKVIPVCGHIVSMKCSNVYTTRDCNNQCPLMLPCGHSCQNKCKEKCTMKCLQLMDCMESLACGHSAKVPCYLNKPESIKEEEALTYCKESCDIILECGHRCSGSCGECYQGRIHKICAENCGVDLVCGHKCSGPCRQVCPPCIAKCIYECCHSKCKKRCGDICTPCEKPCPRRCAHVKCTARCSDKCTVPPCIEPCTKKLPCGHVCIGYCGEPCPPLCLICNQNEVLEFFLGFEEEEGARFVLLQECKHVIESKGMEVWLGNGRNEINVKRCPRCRIPITTTRRYNNYVKDSIEEIQKVKLNFYGHPRENRTVQIELQQRLSALKNQKIPTSKMFNEVQAKIGDLLQPIRNRKNQSINKIMGEILAAKVQILEEICTLTQNSRGSIAAEVIAYIDFLLKRLIVEEYRMTGQEINDYTIEIKRLRRILQLDSLKQTFPSVTQRDLYIELQNQLCSYKPYDINNDMIIKEKLDNLSKQIGGSLIVSDNEIREIVKVIGVKHGAWYKCRCGRPYAIGELGGAMEVSHCANCAVRIRSGNRINSLIKDSAARLRMSLTYRYKGPESVFSSSH